VVLDRTIPANEFYELETAMAGVATGDGTIPIEYADFGSATN